MDMATNMVAIKIEVDDLLPALNQARERLACGEGDLVLDFSSVRRVDAAGLKAIEELTALADQKSTKLLLRGVNVGVYKVLKLVSLVPRVSIMLD
jgi:anti-anti-sigma regulatory factor